MNQNVTKKSAEKGKAVLEDEQIVELYWAREERAIKETDIKYGKYLFTIAYNILHDRMDCEECVSDTYLGTWNSIPPARPTVFQVFLSRITRNISVNRYKKDHASRRIPGELLVSLEELEESGAVLSTEEDDEAAKNLSRIFNDLVKTLTEREEFVFVCRYYYSDKVETIAKMLGVGERTVFRDLEKIKSELKQRLESEGYSV